MSRFTKDHSHKAEDWKCHCGTFNFGSRTKCMTCDDFKSKSKTLTKKPGDWTCPSCQELNFATRNTCRKCSVARIDVNTNTNPNINPTTITDPPKPTTMKPGDWICCVCQKMNFASRSVCMSCSKPKAGLENSLNVDIPPKIGDWRCTACNSTEWNFGSRSNCRTCGAAKVTQPANLQMQQSYSQVYSLPYSQAYSQPTFTPVQPVQPWKERIAPVKVDREFVKTNSQVQPVQPVQSISQSTVNLAPNECKICYDRQISVAFTPCGHTVSCNVCCYAMNKCPICKKPYTEDQIMTVYLA